MTYILFNPLANNGKGTEGLDEVTAAARTRSGGVQPVLLDMTAGDPAAVLLGLSPADEAIICGGDGTLHRLINALDGAVPAADVYVWRLGTGNDFLRDVLGSAEQKMVRLNDYIKDLPLGETGGVRRRFLNNVSFGLDGQVCELGEQEKTRLGRPVNYIALTLRLVLRDFRTTSATVTVDGESRTYERVWLASAFNGRYVGGGQLLAPGQDRLGDKLCCVVLYGLGRAGALLKLPRVVSGRHGRMAHCDIRFGHDISVTFDHPAALNMDGEPFPRTTGFRAVKPPRSV